MARQVSVKFKATEVELTFQLLRQIYSSWIFRLALLAVLARIVWDVVSTINAGRSFDPSFLLIIPAALLVIPMMILRFRFGGGKFKEQKWEFSDEGINLQTEAMAANYKWKQFYKAASDLWFYYLYYKKDAAVFIPRRALETREAEDVFKSLVRKHLAASLK
jgi:hypothetical protein